METNISELPSRTTSGLRHFTGGSGQRNVHATRFPSFVGEVNPPDDDGDDYWRFAQHRQTLEGLCVKYQGYDAWGDENDCNINIVPGPGSTWMVDRNLLLSLATSNDAPTFNFSSVKRSSNNELMIEAEASLDDALYDQFTTDGLPIRSGGTWPDEDYNVGQGPTGKQVGVYGVFCGDYGHGGRPEIHPFDAFWRFHSAVGGNSLSIDVGVFQDDSNRFNNDWSKPPIDIELRIPFAVDFPVTSLPVAKAITFKVRKSPRCKKVSKNVVSSGVTSIAREFVGATTAKKSSMNRLTIQVMDETGSETSNLALSLVDVHVTTSANPLGKLRACWLSGFIRLRVAVGQDGFWYGNILGPNSASAPTATGEPVLIFDPPTEFAPDRHLVETGRRRRAPRGETGRPAVAATTVDLAARSARVTLEIAGRKQHVEIQARQASSSHLGLDDSRGFGLSTRLTRRRAGRRPDDRPIEAEISGLVRALAGLAPASRSVRPVPVRLRLVQPTALELHGWYAGVKEGLPGGEAHPAAALILEQVPEFDVMLTGVLLRRVDGTSDRRIGHVAAGHVAQLGPWRLAESRRLRNLDIPALQDDTPVVVEVECVVRDAFGLEARAASTSENFVVLDPGHWLQDAVGLRPSAVRDLAEQIGSQYLASCDPADLEASRILTTLSHQAALLEKAEEAAVHRVSGLAGLAIRAAELVPAFSLPLGP